VRVGEAVADTKVRGRASSLRRSQIAAVLGSCRGAFIGIGVVSGIINVLMLTSSLFMMQVYDRVLGSQSVPTLVALSLIAVAAYLFQGWLDILRGRVLALIGERVDAEIGPKVHAAVVDLPLRTPNANQEALQPFRQLEALRSFLAGAGPVALFDMPWMPIYLAVCFLFHPWLGWLTLGGALVLVVLTLITEVKSKGPAKIAMDAQSLRNAAADAAQRGAEVVRAMGMFPALAARWDKAHEGYLLAQRRANHVVSGLSATAKMFRFILQSTLLGMGGYLAIRGQISSGTIIAGSILGSRALAPVDQAIASWKAFMAARQGYQRLKMLLALYPDREKPFALPQPSKNLIVEGLAVAAPGTSKPIVRRLSLKLEAGQALGIIGPSASGKSSLARAIVGVWPPQSGKVMARALYGNPFLIVLDEPNSNLDAEGEAAVGAAITALKARGAIAVVIAHRPSAIAAVDLILVMKEGEAVAFGPKEEVLARTVQNARQILGRPAQRADGRMLQGADGGPP
jgi:ATP-binding cassette subfamily C protein